MSRITTLDLPMLSRHFIGADHLFEALDRSFGNSFPKTDNYPPYDIVQIDDNNYLIELAVAGFGEGEIDVTTEGSVMTISGSKEKVTEQNVKNYVHRGISSRSFNRTFTLGENVIVKSALVKNGMLSISLERLIPEEMKPKKIAISYSK